MKARVVSGMRPTGKLHLGHLVGALNNWAPLQDTYDCFYFVADWHALTSDYADTTAIVPNALRHGRRLDCGRPRPRAEHAVRAVARARARGALPAAVDDVPIPWLERVPTYKEQMDQLSEKDLSTLGFLGYPLLQTADVIIYDAQYVPVGEDQVPHLELSREIVQAVPQLFRRAVRRAAADADKLLPPAGARQPQDEQELRQHDQPVGRCGGRAKEGDADVHGPQSGSCRRAGHGRGQSCLQLSRRVQSGRRRSGRPQGRDIARARSAMSR